MGANEYPFGDMSRALEQLGWVKADIDRLKAEALKREDLLRQEAELKDFIREIEDQRIKKTEAALDNWWRHKEVELGNVITEAIRVDREKREAERAKLLDEQGLEVGPDGRIKSKVNPVRAFFVQNWFVLIGVAVATAIAQPDWFNYVWQPIVRLIF